MLGIGPIFQLFRGGVARAPLLSLILLGSILALTFAQTGALGPVQQPAVEISAADLSDAGNFLDLHGDATQQVCHASGFCTAAALTAPAALPLGMLATDEHDFDPELVGVARVVRPDIRPPIA